MTRLYVSVLALLVVFSCSMGFFGATAWDAWWVWAVVGAVLLLAFLALGGLLIPAGRRAVTPKDAPSANLLMQALGAVCTLEVLILGLILWIWGNRSYADSTPYQVLGLLIFLALIGAGAPGAIVAALRLLRERSLLHNAERAALHQSAAASHH